MALLVGRDALGYVFLYVVVVDRVVVLVVTLGSEELGRLLGFDIRVYEAVSSPAVRDPKYAPPPMLHGESLPEL